MSIRSELNKTASFIQNAKNAVIGRGGDISQSAGFKNLPLSVFNIPADASLASQEDSSLAYEKIVPSNVEEYALVKMAGGMSYKPLGNNNMCAEDGVYTLQNESSFKINLGVLQPGNYYFSYESNISGDGETGVEVGWNTISYGTYSFEFEVPEPSQCYFYTVSEDTMYQNGIKLNGTIENFMLCKADDADKTYKSYQPPILLNTKPTSIESRGANLFDGSRINMFAESGITVEYDEATQIFTLNGTSTTSTRDCLTNINIKGQKGAYYTLKVEIVSGNVTIPSSGYAVAFFGSNNTLGKYENWFSRSLVSSGSVNKQLSHEYITQFWFYISNGTVVDNLKVKIMLAQTSDANIPYVPYSAEPIATLEIPESIQTECEGWGLGIDAEYNNHLEWRNGRVFYVQMVKPYTYNGTENFVAHGAISTGLYRYSNTLPSDARKGTVNGLCSHYPTWNGVWNTNTEESVRFGQGNTAFYLYLANEFTTDEVKSLTQGMGIVYALAEPIETDITHLFANYKNLLKVEGGGSILLNNEHNKPVPSTIKYTLKVGS